VRIETESADLIVIRDADGGRLDPITVLLRDVAPGSGQLIVECYGQAWSAWWGAMGERDLRTFVTDCHPAYISNRLDPKGGKYLLRVVSEIQGALRRRIEQPRTDAGGDG
jgi:hypothetical protein